MSVAEEMYELTKRARAEDDAAALAARQARYERTEACAAENYPHVLRMIGEAARKKLGALTLLASQLDYGEEEFSDTDFVKRVLTLIRDKLDDDKFGTRVFDLSITISWEAPKVTCG